MQRHTPTRATPPLALTPAITWMIALATVWAIGFAPLHAQFRHQRGHEHRQLRAMRTSLRQSPAQTPAPVERRPPPASLSYAASGEQEHSQLDPGQQRHPRFHGQRGEHLAQWMKEHENLTPHQQQQALEREPGFRNLPQPQQQRIRNHLTQLDAMNPRQRQRELAHIELMEHLNPAQRQQFRGAMQQLGSLPPDQRHAVARSFRELREIPPGLRASALNSYRYNWMNPAQRAALINLLQIEPLLPPPGR